MRVIAKDQIGNEFPKEVFCRAGVGWNEGHNIICLGWPVEYVDTFIVSHYPFQKDLCIDITGQNHKRSPVTISAEQMNAVCEKFCEELILSTKPKEL